MKKMNLMPSMVFKSNALVVFTVTFRELNFSHRLVHFFILLGCRQ